MTNLNDFSQNGRTVSKNFTKVSNEIIRSPLLTGEQKIIYVILKSFNPSFPSDKKLQKLTGYGRKKIIKIRQSLKQLDLINWDERMGKTNLYNFYTNGNTYVSQETTPNTNNQPVSVEIQHLYQDGHTNNTNIIRLNAGGLNKKANTCIKMDTGSELKEKYEEDLIPDEEINNSVLSRVSDNIEEQETDEFIKEILNLEQEIEGKVEWVGNGNVNNKRLKYEGVIFHK